MSKNIHNFFRTSERFGDIADTCGFFRTFVESLEISCYLTTFVDIFGHLKTFLDIREIIKHFKMFLDISRHPRTCQMFKKRIFRNNAIWPAITASQHRSWVECLVNSFSFAAWSLFAKQRSHKRVAYRKKDHFWIKAPTNDYAWYAEYALINGKLNIFGGNSDGKKLIYTNLSRKLILLKKIARLDDCSFTELSARLNEERKYGHAALSIENGQKGKIRFISILRIF